MYILKCHVRLLYPSNVCFTSVTDVFHDIIAEFISHSLWDNQGRICMFDNHSTITAPISGVMHLLVKDIKRITHKYSFGGEWRL